jgi:hypothetical protein
LTLFCEFVSLQERLVHLGYSRNAFLLIHSCKSSLKLHSRFLLLKHILHCLNRWYWCFTRAEQRVLEQYLRCLVHD